MRRFVTAAAGLLAISATATLNPTPLGDRTVTFTYEASVRAPDGAAVDDLWVPIPHHQYLYDEESAFFGANYVDAYYNAIRWVDKNVGMLVEELAQAGLLDRTLLVVASDHGEAFMEHGREGHARDVYGEVTTTPLVMRLPSLLPPGTVVEPRVQNVDVWPTILDLLDLPELPGAQGRSLVPLIDAAVGRDAPDAADVTSPGRRSRRWIAPGAVRRRRRGQSCR